MRDERYIVYMVLNGRIDSVVFGLCDDKPFVLPLFDSERIPCHSPKAELHGLRKCSCLHEVVNMRALEAADQLDFRQSEESARVTNC